MRSDISELLELADQDGEERVIRDVARRAGLLWTCQCGHDNVRTRTCGDCTRPDPFGVD